MSKSMFLGNDPNRGTVEAETRGWIVYRLDERAGWVYFKLASKTIMPKGNFWLSWDVIEKRIAMGSDAKKLNSYHPDVFDWVVEVMRAA